MGDTRSILWRAGVNALIDLIIAAPILWLYLYGKPTERGFFCNDESIRHPYLSSTMPASILYIVGIILPLLVIILVESFGRNKIPQEGSLVWNRYTIPSVAVNIYFVFVGYLFGLVVTQCLTDIIKYSVGRLRPHFLTVCNPDFSLIDCGTETHPIYVTEYSCRGNATLFHQDDLETRHRIKEARISFVSGHSSFAFQMAIFLILYLQARAVKSFQRKKRVLIIPLFQFLVLALAVFTAVSRVMDYKHHAGDVIGGALLGSILQIFNVVFVMKLFSRNNIVIPRRNSRVIRGGPIGVIENGLFDSQTPLPVNDRSRSPSNQSSSSHPL